MHNKRLKSILQAHKENTKEAARGNYPHYFSFVVDNRKFRVPIAPTHYIDKEVYLATEDNIPFVEVHEENYKWLHEFATQIVKDGHDDSNPLHNFNLDMKNPGISGFRLYANLDKTSDKIDFMHVQVRRIPEKTGLFQLDYYEENENKEMENKLVGICDISCKSRTVYDLVVNRTPYSTANAMDIMSRVACLFRDILIYMRIWAYDEPMASRVCEVLPLYAFKS